MHDASIDDRPPPSRCWSFPALVHVLMPESTSQSHHVEQVGRRHQTAEFISHLPEPLFVGGTHRPFIVRNDGFRDAST
jgi:hypothetical protein